MKHRVSERSRARALSHVRIQIIFPICMVSGSRRQGKTVEQQNNNNNEQQKNKDTHRARTHIDQNIVVNIYWYTQSSRNIIITTGSLNRERWLTHTLAHTHIDSHTLHIPPIFVCIQMYARCVHIS